jgi:hypothetical protein
MPANDQGMPANDQGMAVIHKRRKIEDELGAESTNDPPLTPSAFPGLIGLVASFLEPKDLCELSFGNRCLRDCVCGPELASIWKGLLGKISMPLLPNGATSMCKYLSLRRLNLTGTWLDTGIDRSAKHRYSLLTAMKQTCGGLQKTFQAVSLVGERQLKRSHGRLSGGVYCCHETFVNSETQELLPGVNIAGGLLDLRNPKRPRIFGTWTHLEMEEGEDNEPSPQMSTTGTFDFVKVNDKYDEKAAHDDELRKKAGLGWTKDLIAIWPTA